MEWLIFSAGVLQLAGIYVCLGLILNLEAGWGGMWDLGVAGLVAAGAYFYIITTQTGIDVAFAPGWPLWLGVLGASLFTALVAVLIGAPSLRLRGEYFLITTFAFAEVIRHVITNLNSITRGTTGFQQVDRPLSSLVEPSDYRFVLLGIVAVVAASLYWLTRRLGRSPYGRLLRAQRDNEQVALALGKHVARYRIQTFALVGALYGAVAPLYVWHIRSVVPQLFTPNFTFTVWIALTIGGIGSFSGPVIGGLILIVVTEMLSFLQVSPEHAQLLAASRPLILGLFLILAMRFRPGGLVTERHSFHRVGRQLP